MPNRKELLIRLAPWAIMVSGGMLCVANYLFPGICGVRYTYIHLGTAMERTIVHGFFLGAQKSSWEDTELSMVLHNYNPRCKYRNPQKSGFVLIGLSKVGFMRVLPYDLATQHSPHPVDGQVQTWVGAKNVAILVSIAEEDGFLNRQQAGEMICKALLYFRLAEVEELRKLERELAEILQEDKKSKSQRTNPGGNNWEH